MSREVPFDSEAFCDECGNQGAYDFMGDYYCGPCLWYLQNELDEMKPEVDWEDEY